MSCDSSDDLSRSLLVGSNAIYLLPTLSLFIARRYVVKTAMFVNEFDIGFVASTLCVFVASSLFHMCYQPSCTSWCIDDYIQTEYADGVAAFASAVIVAFSGAPWATPLKEWFIVELVIIPTVTIHLMTVPGIAYLSVGTAAVLITLVWRVTHNVKFVRWWWPFALVVIFGCFVWALVTQYDNLEGVSYTSRHSQWHGATGIAASAVPFLFSPTPVETITYSAVEVALPKLEEQEMSSDKVEL